MEVDSEIVAKAIMTKKIPPPLPLLPFVDRIDFDPVGDTYNFSIQAYSEPPSLEPVGACRAGRKKGGIRTQRRELTVLVLVSVHRFPGSPNWLR